MAYTMIITAHNSAKLDRTAENKGLLLVYFNEEWMRPQIHRIDRPYEIVFMHEMEHDTVLQYGQEGYFAHMLVQTAADAFSKDKPIVYVLVPEAFLDTVSEVAEKVSDSVSGMYFTVKKQDCREMDLFDEYGIFALFETNIHGVRFWDFVEFTKEALDRFDRESLSHGLLRRTKHQFKSGVKKEKHPEKKMFDLEKAYTTLAADPASVALDAIDLDDLRKLLDKCLDTDRTDLVPIVGEAIREKEGLA